MRATFEVAHILQRNHQQLKDITPNTWQLRTLYALSAFRTPILGEHIDISTKKYFQRNG